MAPIIRQSSPALIIVLMLAACGGDTGVVPVAGTEAASASTAQLATPGATPSAEPTRSAASDLLGAWTVATIELGGGPDLPTEAFGSLWVLTVDGELMGGTQKPSVNRIDPATNEIIASVELPGRVCQGIGASPEALWACGPDGLIRIDPTTNEVVATIQLDAALIVSRIAYGAGSVWAFATTGVAADTVVRIDPATNEVVATIQLGRAANCTTFGFDALWVSSAADDVVMRVDPATNAVEAWTEELPKPGCISVGHDALWVALHAEENVQIDADEPTLARIDPESGAVVALITTGGSAETAGCVFAGPDDVWMRAPDPFLARVDPATNEVTDTITSISGPGDVTVAFGSVWVTWERGEVLRLDPS